MMGDLKQPTLCPLNVRFQGYLNGSLNGRFGAIRQSCAGGRLLCVRLTERALRLSDCASDACFRLR
jgi:hypothetical protein